MEGSHCYAPSTGCSRTGKTLPLTEYGHTNGRCSITGGFVYRGAAYPDLVGAYLFADYCSGEIWYIDRGAARGTAPIRAPGHGRCRSPRSARTRPASST